VLAYLPNGFVYLRNLVLIRGSSDRRGRMPASPARAT
jgi:hypothetical protein